MKLYFIAVYAFFLIYYGYFISDWSEIFEASLEVCHIEFSYQFP